MKSKLTTFLLILVFSYAVLETGTCILVKNNLLHGDTPSFSFSQIGARFWSEVHNDFGVWHAPNSSFRHKKSCFEVTYTANAEGMRDQPRERKSEQDRVVMLGDSFVEGWGVQEPERLSNLLETSTGKAFLNFGTSGHFSPTQYYLLYKTLAKNFSHDEVVVGILPSNDFNEDDYEVWQDKGRYRPFWVGDYPNYQLVYSQSPPGGVALKRYMAGFFREFSYLYNVVKFFIMSRELEAHTTPTQRGPELFSKFYDFTDAEYHRLIFSLEKLREEAQSKKLTVFLIPILNDLKRFDQSGPSPLAERLGAWGREKGVQVLDLSPWMHDHAKDWTAYYFPCDEHWSSAGHQAAFEFLKKFIPRSPTNT